ncbi:MAG: RNA methyltransferase [Clostridia bacterium]|nr:RNA methyltransferase [Clostridia bacterium]
MTSLSALLEGRRDGVNDRPIFRVLFDETRKEKEHRELDFLQKKAIEYGYELQLVPPDEIDRLALGTTHGGVLADCGERTLPRLADCVENIEEKGFYAMIQGIEDPYNFGYALRSLYACGASGIILSERNWFNAAGVVARSSAGASERFRVFVSDPVDVIKLFHKKGYTVVCADEQTDNILHETPLKMPLLLIVGGERRGISKSILEQADIVVKIPYGRDFRASLSAASATTILGYEILRQNFISAEK